MFGAGSGLIILDEMECQGSEGSIADCRHSTWGKPQLRSQRRRGRNL